MTVLEEVSQQLHKKKYRLTTAESCTGGWIAKQITDLAGSSAIFDRGFVTYSNQAKQEMINVSENTLDKFGAVSEQVVKEMALGALNNSSANISLSVSGIAGPGGGTAEKPVGMVCFGWAISNKDTYTETAYFDGDRDSIRKQAVQLALKGILKMIK